MIDLSNKAFEKVAVLSTSEEEQFQSVLFEQLGEIETGTADAILFSLAGWIPKSQLRVDWDFTTLYMSTWLYAKKL